MKQLLCLVSGYVFAHQYPILFTVDIYLARFLRPPYIPYFVAKLLNMTWPILVIREGE